MAILPILTYPDPFLLKPVKPVSEISDELQALIENMAETMYHADGVGLASIQAGIEQSIVVYDPAADKENRNYRVLINPRILEYHGATLSENEGCLSVPDMRCDITRAERIVVEGLDRQGNLLNFEADGIAAVILQHEIDHLNGKLIVDHVSSLKRQIYKRKRQKLMKADEE